MRAWLKQIRWSGVSYICLGLLLVALAVIAPANHDEGQYLAAIRLAQDRRVFVDFLSLQTPYQIYVFAPFMALFPAGGYVALRILTALLGVAIIAMVGLGQRFVGVSARRSVATALAMALCYSFLFSVTLVRNDALPAFALTLALVLALKAGARPGFATGLGCGLLLGFAIGVKVSYGVPAAGFGLWLVLDGWRRRDTDVRWWQGAAGCLGGGLLALAPLLAIRASAAVAFDFGVFTFGFEGPAYWYGLNGFGDRLTFARKLADFAGALAVGPGLAALLIVAVIRLRAWRRGESPTPAANLLDAMIVAGLIAALLPTPTWRQYLMPLLPPLFIRLGQIWQQEAAQISRLLRGVVLMCALAGLVPVGIWIKRGLDAARPSPLRLTEEGRWVAAQMRAAGLRGSVATFAPQIIVDAGLHLDPRFATGPFAYRSAPILPQHLWARAQMTGERSLAADLAVRLPAAVITGYEDGDTMDRLGIDKALRGWAQRQCYTLVRSPMGQAELYLAPAAGQPCPQRQ